MQRVEVIARTERRRRWSDEEKYALVAEAFAPGAVVSHVARCHGVAESCLFSWRKRFAQPPTEAAQEPRMIPVTVEPSSPSMIPLYDSAPPPGPCTAVITLADGTRLEVPASYPATALKALIAVLRPAR